MEMAGVQSFPQSGRKREFWVPLLFTLIVYGLSLWFGGKIYHTNDDVSIQDILAGRYTGAPYPIHQFIGIFISGPVSWMYQLFPGTEWWFVYNQMMMFLGMLLINGGIWRCCAGEKLSAAAAIILMMVLDAGFLLYPVSFTAYTIVSVFMGCGALSLVMSAQALKKRNLVFLAAGGMLLLSLFTRWESGIVVSCFAFIAVLYFHTSGNESWKRIAKRTAAVILVWGIAAGALTAVSQHVIWLKNGEDFRLFNSARTRFTDYPHDSWEENPELFESIGWDEDFYQLARFWYYLDPRVSTENFQTITENSKAEGSTFHAETLGQRWEHFQTRPNIELVENFWLILTLFAIIAVIAGKNRRDALLLGAGILGTDMLVLYQLVTGRILYRSFVVCLIPSAFISVMLAIRSLGRTQNKKLISCIWALFLLVICIPLMIDSRDAAFGDDAVLKAEEKIQKEAALSEYAREHSSLVFFKDTQVTVDESPWADRPINLLDWGKPDFGSEAQKQKMRLNGIDEPGGEVFKRPNVRFVTTTDLSANIDQDLETLDKLMHLYHYLQKDFQASGIIQDGQIWEGVFVYQFVFGEEGNKPGTFNIEGATVIYRK